MHRGLARGRRGALVAQAALVWSDASADELEWFIETGELPGSAPQRMPYDPDVAAKIDQIRNNGGKLIITAEG